MNRIAFYLVAALAATSQLQAQQASWTLSSRGTPIGEQDTDLFQSIRYGRLLPNGLAMIADGGGHFVHLYGPDGARRAAMGRKGSGPGEFQYIHGIWLTPDGKIGVWDGQLRRITTFELDGKVVATHAVRAENNLKGNLEIFFGSLRNGDLLLGTLFIDPSQSGSDRKSERWMLGRFAATGEFRQAAGEVQGMSRFRGDKGGGPLPFTPVARIALRGDTIWVADGFDPELRAQNLQGAVVKRTPLAWTVRPPADQVSLLEPKLQAPNKRFSRELVQTAPEPEQVPQVGGILIDDRGNLWVKQYDPSTDSIYLKSDALAVASGGTWRVLSPNGTWVASVRMPPNLLPLDIRGDRLLAVVRDDLDVDHVVVHTIAR